MSCRLVPVPKRRALAIRLWTAIEVEALPALRRDKRSLDLRAAFISFLLSQANRVAIEPTDEVQDALRQVRQEIGAWPLRCDPAAQSVFERARERLVARLSEERCEGCTQSAEGCEEGPCLAELHQLALLVERKVRDLYLAYAKLPGYELASLVVENTTRGADQALLHECHIDGWTDVRHSSHGAEVGLALEDDKLDWTVLCQCLYVLVHEFVCHAFQGSGAPDRQNADPVCSWSDGWMDAFAWQQLEQWLDRGNEAMPDWLRQDPESVKDHCRALHLRRYQQRQGPLLTEARLLRRNNARRGYQSLRRLYSEARSGVRGAVRAADRFSIQFNVDFVDRELRDEVSALLESGLYLDQAISTSRTMQVARCCEAYARHRDAATLAAELARAIGPEQGLRALLDP